MSFDQMLPLIFMAVMGLSLLIYVVLDGYDLGVGMLLPRADARREGHDDRVASARSGTPTRPGWCWASASC